MYIKRTEQNVDIQKKKIGTVSRMLSLLSKENFFLSFKLQHSFGFRAMRVKLHLIQVLIYVYMLLKEPRCLLYICI